MLTIEAITSKGERHSLSHPVSLTLSRDLYTPADILTAVLPFSVEEEVAFVTVHYQDEEIFRGIADEQIVLSGENVKTKLVCRSTAALLLDNEACPQSFTDASAGLVFSRYAAPYGFTLEGESETTLKGEFRVQKGVSCYKVLEDFAAAVYGTIPYVSGSKVSMKGAVCVGEAVLSNIGDGIPFTSLEYNRLRCKLISRVRVKLEQGGEYSAVVKDEEAIRRGIERERYINATELSSKTLSDADRLISASRSKGETVTVNVPFCMTDVLGKSASVRDKWLGNLTGFCVTGIRYSLTQDSENTRLILTRKES